MDLLPADRGVTPDLRTARLHLRPLGPGDADQVAAMIGDFEVSRWLTRVPHPFEVSMAREFIARPRPPQHHVWAITGPDGAGALMGVIGLEGEFGYWLGRSHWGHGYMTEAAGAVVRQWRAEGTGDHLLSGHHLGNGASRTILTRLGFRDTHREEVLTAAQPRPVTVQKMRLDR